jgi:hypothetical protein
MAWTGQIQIPLFAAGDKQENRDEKEGNQAHWNLDTMW